MPDMTMQHNIAMQQDIKMQFDDYKTLHITLAKTGYAQILLNRPQRRNAFNALMITELMRAFTALGQNDAVRCIVLKGQGKVFCAGADISMMQQIAKAHKQDNCQSALALANMLSVIDNCPKPVIAQVHGAAMGGGIGLLAVSDIVIAAKETVFALSEARLGLIPATIAPFTIRAIGQRQARRYFLTAERFNAGRAQQIGLVHEVCAIDDLAAQTSNIIDALLACGPKAQQAAKALIDSESDAPVGAAQNARLASLLADIRASAEGQEGLAAFLEKRAPSWLSQSQMSQSQMSQPKASQS